MSRSGGNPVMVFVGTIPLMVFGTIALGAGPKYALLVGLPVWSFIILLWVLYIRSVSRAGMIAKLGWTPETPKRRFGYGFLVGLAIGLPPVIFGVLYNRSGARLPQPWEDIFIVLYVGGFWVLALVCGLVAHWWAKTDTSVPSRLLREQREEGIKRIKEHQATFGPSFFERHLEWQQERDTGKTTLEFGEWSDERYPQRKLLKS